MASLDESDDSDTEIVVVSDTVRLRRSRTPSNNAGGGNSMNLPDVLPNTFRLAEQSSLFSHMDDEAQVTRRAHENFLNTKSFAVSTPQVSHITLEKVQYFEPEHAETVNIVDLSEDNASDTSEGGHTPILSHGRKTAERINSFYDVDLGEGGQEEPLVFSEDEDTELETNLVHLRN